MNKKIINIIKKNYNIKIDKIEDNPFIFNNEKIYVYIVNESNEKIKKLFELSNNLYYKGIRNSTFLYNKEKNVYTQFEEKKIILMKINDRNNDIDKGYIKKINISKVLERTDIKKKWEKEIDNYEKKYADNIKRKYFDNYYIGMGENAIKLIEKYNGKDEDLCHDINMENYNIISFNNPFNYINQNYLYDLANYIKYNYFNENINEEEIEKIITKIKKYDDQIFFYSNMLFPNYYFETNKEINRKKIKMYEKLLLICKNEMNNKVIDEVEWIKEI